MTADSRNGAQEEIEVLLESLDYVAKEGDRYKVLCEQAARTIRELLAENMALRGVELEPLPAGELERLVRGE